MSYALGPATQRIQKAARWMVLFSAGLAAVVAFLANIEAAVVWTDRVWGNVGSQLIETFYSIDFVRDERAGRLVGRELPSDVKLVESQLVDLDGDETKTDFLVSYSASPSPDRCQDNPTACSPAYQLFRLNGPSYQALPAFRSHEEGTIAFRVYTKGPVVVKELAGGSDFVPTTLYVLSVDRLEPFDSFDWAFTNSDGRDTLLLQNLGDYPIWNVSAHVVRYRSVAGYHELKIDPKTRAYTFRRIDWRRDDNPNSYDVILELGDEPVDSKQTVPIHPLGRVFLDARCQPRNFKSIRFGVVGRNTASRENLTVTCFTSEWIEFEFIVDPSA